MRAGCRRQASGAGPGRALLLALPGAMQLLRGAGWGLPGLCCSLSRLGGEGGLCMALCSCARGVAGVACPPSLLLWGGEGGGWGLGCHQLLCGAAQLQQVGGAELGQGLWRSPAVAGGHRGEGRLPLGRQGSCSPGLLQALALQAKLQGQAS